MADRARADENRAENTQQRFYDYVFIGAGATGGTAAADLVDRFAQANELKKKGFSVLMLEGGVDKKVPSSDIPIEHGQASEDPDLLADPNRTGRGSGYWVRHFADDKQAFKDPKARADGMIWKPRGEGYGGSTRMNANIFVRVQDKDWDALALNTGDPAFRAKNMKPLLVELTSTEYRPVLKTLHTIGKTIGWAGIQNLGGHGFEGPLEITRANPRLLTIDPQLEEVALKGFWWSLRKLGSPIEKIKRVTSSFDPNDDLTQNTEGPVLVPMTVNREGKRVGARDLLLDAKDRHPDRLTLQDGARVDRLFLNDKNKVTGLLYRDPQGKNHEIKIGREAIVAAGAMESAALLMRSGIGPKSELDKLKAHGVEPKDILEGVGKKQGFRYEVGVVVRLKKPLSVLEEYQLPSNPDNAKNKDRKPIPEMLAATNGAFLAWQARSRPDLADPDLFVFAVPGRFSGYKPGYSREATTDPNLLTFLILDKNKGESSGTLEIDPNNPTGAPMINHHFHMERKQGDSAPIVAGIKQVREFISSQLGDLVETEVWPGPEQKSDEQLADKIVSESWDHHPRGGAQLGNASDPNTVVDSDFKVLGTTGLRVIDASVLPNNIGEFIVSGLYQVGKLAARKIASEAEQGPEPAQTFNPLSIVTNEAPKSLEAAQGITKKSANSAEAHKMINKQQHAALTDGTVSNEDLELAWNTIDQVMKNGEKKGSKQHTLAHNLLLSISRQLEHQGTMRTGVETAKDYVWSMIGSR